MASRPDDDPPLWNEPCSDSHLVKISKLIPEWKEVAPFLNLSAADEVDIFDYCPRSTQVQRIRMLRTWSEKNGKDATYKRLADAFEDCDRQDLIDKLRELANEKDTSRLLTAPASHQLSHSSFLQKYARHLKNIYASKKTPVYDKDYSLLRVKAKSFINIALVHKDTSNYTAEKDSLMDRLHGHVDAIEKKKTNLEFNDVCKCEDGSLAHSVLVEGAPGVGKTTFAFEFCKQWAKGEIGKEWEVVVIIKLRDQRAREAESLHDLLYYPDSKTKQKIIDELIERDGEGMLLILDGYDELSDSQRCFKSIIQELMSKELLCSATLMVTSRPIATRTLHSEFQQSIDQHIEVLGFKEKNIEEYIKSACGDKPELVSDFKSYLSSHPFSSSLMYNPLQCAIVTDLYRCHWEHGNKGFAPKTLTELYTGLVNTLLLRYLTNHPAHKDKDWRIQDLNALPKDVKQIFETVTELAAKGLQKQQYVFEEIKDNVPSDTLGLMQREEQMDAGIGRSSSQYFLHLTLQEFFAAISYSEQSDLLKKLFSQHGPFSFKIFFQYYGKKNKEIDRYSFVIHWPVTLFIAGRTKLSSVPVNFLQDCLYYDVYKQRTHVNVAFLHLLYETQCPELIQSTLTLKCEYISTKGYSPLDWFVIGYCIANSCKSVWRVKKLANSNSQHLHKLVLSLDTAAKFERVSGKIASLHIADNSWSNIFEILVWLQPHASSVTEMKLVGQKPKRHFSKGTGFQKSIESDEEMLMNYQALEKLRVRYADATFPTSIFKTLQQQNNLQLLFFNACSFSSKVTASLLNALHSPYCQLRELTLEDCNIIDNDANSKKVFFKLLNVEKVSVSITGSCTTISHILLKPHFYSNKLSEMNIFVEEKCLLSSEVLELNMPHYPMLESLKISGKLTRIRLYLTSQTLHTLILKSCRLDHETTSMLLHFLHFPLCQIHTLTLNDCCISNYPTFSLKLQNTDEKFSLSIVGSSQVVSHMLSQDHFYGSRLTEMSIRLSCHSQVTPTFLAFATKQYPALETLKILGSNGMFVSPLVFNSSHVRILSLGRINFNDEAIKSLICYLQSPHCQLHTLTLRNCIKSECSEFRQYGGDTFTLTLTLLHPNNSELTFTGSNQVVSFLLPQLHFIAQGLEELNISLIENEATIEAAPSQFPMVQNYKLTGTSVISPSFLDFGSQMNRLNTLSFSRCYFSDEAITMLINSLQSHCSRLQLLELDECTIHGQGIDCHNHCDKIITTFQLQLMKNRILHIKATSNLTLRMLLKFQFITQTLTELKLICADLECRSTELGYFCTYKNLPLSPKMFDFITKQNNLHTLSINKHVFSSETTTALVRSLQSPHCKILELTLLKCTIPTPSRALLERVIAGSAVSQFSFTHAYMYSKWLPRT